MFILKQKQKGKGFLTILILILFSSLILPGYIFASNGYAPRELSTLESGETLEGIGFFTGNVIRLDGTVEGTTFAAGQGVTVNGNINGDLFVAAQVITINGTVSGNIYGAGQEIIIRGQGGSDGFLAAQNIMLDKEGGFLRDLLVAGAVTTINGRVGRNVGIQGDVVNLLDSALIEGNFSYQSPQEATIASGAKIGGQLDWQQVEVPQEMPVKKPVIPMIGAVAILLNMAGALFVWFIIRMWKPEVWIRTSEKTLEAPFKTLGKGAIAFIVIPVLAVLLMITVIGIPAGILLAMAYGVSLYLCKIIVAVFIGTWLRNRFGWKEIHKGVWFVLMGLVILTLLCLIPVVKIFIWFLVLFAGFGGIASALDKSGKPVQNKRETAESVPVS